MTEAKQTFRYRDHVRKMPKVMGIFGGLYTAGMLVFMTVAQLWTLAPLVAFLAVEVAVVVWFLRRLGSTEITLGDAGIEVRNCAKHFFIAYNEIEHIDSGSIPYLGGWVRVRARNGDAFRATVTLEGISQLLTKLKQGVDRHNMQAVYDRDRLFRFFKTAVYCEQSWHRMGKAALPFVFGIGILSMVVSSMGPMVFIPFAAGVLVYMWTEFVFGRHVAKNADPIRFTAPARSPDLEKRTYVHAAIAWFVLVVPSMAFILFV